MEICQKLRSNYTSNYEDITAGYIVYRWSYFDKNDFINQSKLHENNMNDRLAWSVLGCTRVLS